MARTVSEPIRNDSLNAPSVGTRGDGRSNVLIVLQAGLSILNMSRRFVAVAVALALCLFFYPHSPKAAQPQDSERTALAISDIASRVTPSVVVLTTPTGTGSGVIVDASGVLLTSLHVI